MTKNKTNWKAMNGEWDFDQSGVVNFLRIKQGNVGKDQGWGLALCNQSLIKGEISTNITFSMDGQEPEFCQSGRIFFGYSHTSGCYYAAGLGGYDREFVLVEYDPSVGWIPLSLNGKSQNIKKDKKYDVKVIISGQNVKLFVDGVSVLEHNLGKNIQGEGLGFFTWGNDKVIFDDINIKAGKPKVFVIMDFSGRYDELYKKVLTITEKFGLDTKNAGDFYQPGNIIEDIISEIHSSDLIIAEITPANRNVYFEVGFAYALKKKIVMLCERETKLPFDIHAERCIFYDNVIGGEANIEERLNKMLSEIYI